MISLINFTIDSRSTEEGWERSRKMNEDINNKMKEEEKFQDERFDFYENFMKDYKERKNKWIEWSNKWQELLKSDLSNERIGNWYFIN